MCSLHIVLHTRITFCTIMLYRITVWDLHYVQWETFKHNVTYPSQWFFHFGEKIIIAWTHIRWEWRLFRYLPSPAVKEICDNVGSMSPCIVMKDDGIRCQQVLSLSPECWTKITEEIAVVGIVYCSWRFWRLITRISEFGRWGTCR
jgi:hypothetical protein